MGLGITTVSQLADVDVEALLPDYLPLTAHRDRSEARLRTAARRARMLKRGVALEKVSVDPIGVPRAPVEVDLDIETDDSDRTYLWGVLLTDRATGKQKYQHFSTFSYLSPSGELDLAADFARWLVRLVRKHPGLLVYHYSDYEVVHLRRMAQRSGHPDLLAACDLVKEHFVDLFQLVRDNFVAVDGLGLKVVAAKGAGFSWRDEEPGGLNSQTWFATAVDGGNAAERKAARRRVLETHRPPDRQHRALRQPVGGGYEATAFPPPGVGDRRGQPVADLRSSRMDWTVALASPKHIAEFSLKNSGFCTPAYPALMERLKITTWAASHTLSTGMPEIGEPGSFAAGLTVSLAPITSTTSVSVKSSLISSISRTMS